jgi:hypothetical protein
MSDWTVETLKEYMDQRFADIALAVTKAEETQDKRLDSMNEFRLQLRDQTGTFITRTEYEGLHQALIDKSDDRFQSMNSRMDRQFDEVESQLRGVTSRLDQAGGVDKGRQSLTAMLISLGAGLAAVAAVVVVAIHP